MDRVTAADRPCVLVAVPPVCAALAWLALLAASFVTGTHPIWTLKPLNLAEAAAFRDGGAVVRFVNAGQDINKAGEVRGGVVRSDPATLTPIEAAAAARESAMVQLLLDFGASPDATVWQRAYCISDADSVRELLESHRPAGTAEDCAEQ